MVVSIVLPSIQIVRRAASIRNGSVANKSIEVIGIRLVFKGLDSSNPFWTTAERMCSVFKALYQRGRSKMTLERTP